MLTIYRAVEQYLEHEQARNLAPRSLKLYRDVLEHLGDYLGRQGRRSMATVKPRDLDAWAVELNRIGLSSGVRRDRVFLARRFFRWIHERGDLLSNPGRDIPVPKKVERLPENPPEAQALENLLNSIPVGKPMDVRDKAILEVLYGCMLRVAELTSLNLTSVNIDDRTLVIRRGKGRKDRVVPLPKRTLDAMLHYLDIRKQILDGKHPKPDAQKALFVSRKSGRISCDAVREIVRRLGLIVGIEDLHPHLLRHAGSLHMLRGRADIRHVQEILGHGDLNTTAKHYTRMTDPDLKDAYDRAFPVLRV